MKSRKVRQYRVMFLGMISMILIVIVLSKGSSSSSIPEAKALVYEEPRQLMTQDIIDENERQMEIYNNENGIFPSVYADLIGTDFRNGDVIELEGIKHVIRSIHLLEEGEAAYREEWEGIRLYDYVGGVQE